MRTSKLNISGILAVAVTVLFWAFTAAAGEAADAAAILPVISFADLVNSILAAIGLALLGMLRGLIKAGIAWAVARVEAVGIEIDADARARVQEALQVAAAAQVGRVIAEGRQLFTRDGLDLEIKNEMVRGVVGYAAATVSGAIQRHALTDERLTALAEQRVLAVVGEVAVRATATPS